MLRTVLIVLVAMNLSLFRWVSGFRTLSSLRRTTRHFHYESGDSVRPENPLLPVGQGVGTDSVLLVSIEGNIGAGKSTLLDALRDSNKDWVFIDEPVKDWGTFKNEAGESMLEVFYKDRRRWSYTFQNCALLTRYQCIEEAVRRHGSGPVLGGGNEVQTTKRRVFITERCLETDYYVFTKMLREDGSLDKLEFDLYERWFKQLKRTSTPLSGIVHVATSPEISAQRIIKRGREGEQSIDLNYLRALDKYQRAWIDSGTVPSVRADVTDAHLVQKFIQGLLDK